MNCMVCKCFLLCEDNDFLLMHYFYFKQNNLIIYNYNK